MAFGKCVILAKALIPVVQTTVIMCMINPDTGNTVTQYTEFTDGTYLFRTGIRGGSFILDYAITPTGFNGTEDIDWENLSTETPQ